MDFLRGKVARVEIMKRYLRLVEEKFKSLLLSPFGASEAKCLTATEAANFGKQNGDLCQEE